MLILYSFIILIVYFLIRTILCLLVLKHGKISYDGFSAAGFAYNSEKDIFYSTMNAWQKNFGYTHAYDVLAPIFRMIIDTEPIKFYYNNKNWLITFWKGQYGIVTGAEVGIYNTKQEKVNKKTVYFPASDSEMLDISFTLYKKDKIITKVHAKHWWLTVFKLGMFSKPKELSMDIEITFTDQQMLQAFLKSFKKKGYSSKKFTVKDNTLCFKYIKPHTRKVWTRTWLTDAIRQHFNRKNVELYNNYLEDLIDDDKIDDSKKTSDKNLIMVNDLLPDLLKNSSETQIDSEQIKKETFSDEEINVIYLDGSSIYFMTRDDDNE